MHCGYHNSGRVMFSDETRFSLQSDSHQMENAGYPLPPREHHWPAYSPDLSPIEHVWDMLDRRIAARQTPSHLSTGTSEGIA
ncbi:hypothetical protein TNCV_144091 [Trichonephila clavipes]|nr:hypothetical protein TNCV_144091 [Trichonephila clavipes]